MYSLLAPIVSLVGAAEGGPITIFVQRSMGNQYPLARIFSEEIIPGALRGPGRELRTFSVHGGWWGLSYGSGVLGV